jgi:hypothetical protein
MLTRLVYHPLLFVLVLVVSPFLRTEESDASD